MLFILFLVFNINYYNHLGNYFIYCTVVPNLVSFFLFFIFMEGKPTVSNSGIHHKNIIIILRQNYLKKEMY